MAETEFGLFLIWLSDSPATLVSICITMAAAGHAVHAACQWVHSMHELQVSLDRYRDSIHDFKTSLDERSRALDRYEEELMGLTQALLGAPRRPTSLGEIRTFLNQAAQNLQVQQQQRRVASLDPPRKTKKRKKSKEPTLSVYDYLTAPDPEAPEPGVPDEPCRSETPGPT